MAAAGGRQQGASLPRHRRWEAIEERALTPQSINLIVKQRCAMAGLGPKEFWRTVEGRISDRGSTSGIALPEAMQQSQHRSVQQAASYYNEAERAQGMARSIPNNSMRGDGRW